MAWRWIDALVEDPAERRLRRLALPALLLVAVPSVVAIGVDLVRPGGLPLVADTDYRDEILVPCPENVKEARSVRLDELPPVSGKTDGIVWVDARTPGEYVAGHVPGALSIPYRAVRRDDPEFRAAFDRDLAPLRGVPGSRIVVCGDERIASGRNLAALLLERGFAGVRYLEGGCESWAADGRPFDRPAAGARAVAIGDLPADLTGWTIVDARFSRNFRRSHVPGALSIPYRVLEGPADGKLAPLRGISGVRILAYGSEARGEGKDLAELLAAGGWPGASYLEGGFEAWEAAGRPIEGAEAGGGDAGGGGDDAGGGEAGGGS
jgi:rhodanese-related sulfurtransferase